MHVIGDAYMIIQPPGWGWGRGGRLWSIIFAWLSKQQSSWYRCCSREFTTVIICEFELVSVAWLVGNEDDNIVLIYHLSANEQARCHSQTVCSSEPDAFIFVSLDKHLGNTQIRWNKVTVGKWPLTSKCLLTTANNNHIVFLFHELSFQWESQGNEYPTVRYCVVEVDWWVWERRFTTLLHWHHNYERLVAHFFSYLCQQ